MKPGHKWRTPNSQVCTEEKQFKLNIAGNVQARTINSVFMLGSAAHKVTETKSSLPVLQELPSHQELVGNQIKTTKKPSYWSRFGKFRVETKRTQKTDHMVDATKKHRDIVSIPRKINPYELRGQELKIEEGKRAKRKALN